MAVGRTDYTANAVAAARSVLLELTLRGIALSERLKEKDAWDIYFCLRHYPGGLDALVREFQPHLAHGLFEQRLDAEAEAAAGRVTLWEFLGEPLRNMVQLGLRLRDGRTWFEPRQHVVILIAMIV